MQEFDPDSGYRVLVRTVSGLVAFVGMISVTLVYTRTSVSGFYFPGVDNRNDGQMLIVLMATAIHFLASAVAGRFAWFAVSCRPAIDLFYLLIVAVVFFVICIIAG